MQKSLKLISSVLISSSFVFLVGCGSNESSSPSETTAAIYVQEDEMTPTPQNETIIPAVYSVTESSVSSDAPTKVPDSSNTAFENLDEVYNTSLAPNVLDDVTFTVTLTYTTDFNTKDPSNSASVIIPLTAGTTYADICNIPDFNLVKLEGENRVYSVDKLASKTESIYEKFKYCGIPHTVNGAIAEWTDDYNDVHRVDPAISLELVKNGEIITDGTSLVSNDNSVLVKAISSNSVAYNSETRVQKKNTPVLLTFTVTTPDGITEDYEVGMRWDSIKKKLENQNLRNGSADSFYFGDKDAYFVLKNSNYSLVFVKEGTYIDNISLIKN